MLSDGLIPRAVAIKRSELAPLRVTIRIDLCPSVETSHDSQHNNEASSNCHSAIHHKESKRTDEHGNHFRYRAKVDDAKHSRVGRWAWDVFLANQ